MPDGIINSPPPTSQQTPGLIDTAPGLASTTTGATPPGNTGPGAPVTGYVPAQAAATQATSTSYTPEAYVPPESAKVATQLKGIIASGSPLMQEARANARLAMNARGIINSTAAIGAGEKAVIDSALPIATSDAATEATAAQNTTTAKNAALSFGATASNTAELANANLGTSTSSFNAGQANAAFSSAAQASNAVAQIAQQIRGSKDITEIQTAMQNTIANLQASTSLTLQDKQSALGELVAHIQADTTLSAQASVNATNVALQASNAMLQSHLADIQKDTTLTAQQMATEASKANASTAALSAQIVAGIQSDASKTIAQQNNETNKIITGMNNANAKLVQQITNMGNLANIKANGDINEKITAMTNENKLLLQSSTGAANFYTNALKTLSDIVMNPNWNADQKSTAMNDQMAVINAGMRTISGVSGIPAVLSDLNFASGTGSATTQPGSTVVQTSPPPMSSTLPLNGETTGPKVVNNANISDLYQSMLGRAPDSAGLAYWLNSGLSMDQMRASFATQPEYANTH